MKSPLVRATFAVVSGFIKEKIGCAHYTFACPKAHQHTVTQGLCVFLVEASRYTVRKKRNGWLWKILSVCLG